MNKLYLFLFFIVFTGISYAEDSYEYVKKSGTDFGGVYIEPLTKRQLLEYTQEEIIDRYALKPFIETKMGFEMYNEYLDRPEQLRQISNFAYVKGNWKGKEASAYMELRAQEHNFNDSSYTTGVDVPILYFTINRLKPYINVGRVGHLWVNYSPFSVFWQWSLKGAQVNGKIANVDYDLFYVNPRKVDVITGDDGDIFGGQFSTVLFKTFLRGDFYTLRELIKNTDTPSENDLKRFRDEKAYHIDVFKNFSNITTFRVTYARNVDQNYLSGVDDRGDALLAEATINPSGNASLNLLFRDFDEGFSPRLAYEDIKYTHDTNKNHEEQDHTVRLSYKFPQVDVWGEVSQILYDRSNSDETKHDRDNYLRFNLFTRLFDAVDVTANVERRIFKDNTGAGFLRYDTIRSFLDVQYNFHPRVKITGRVDSIIPLNRVNQNLDRRLTQYYRLDWRVAYNATLEVQTKIGRDNDTSDKDLDRTQYFYIDNYTFAQLKVWF